MANFPEENAIIAVFKAIAKSNKLRNKLVLKGGYALKHIYKSPRASVDIDFTKIKNLSNKPDKQLQKLLDEINNELNESLKSVIKEFNYTDMRVQSSSVKPANKKLRQHPSLEIKIGYSRKKKSPPYSDVVKLEISLNDIICEYQYFQEGTSRLRVSSLNDIIAEKLRAILQQIERDRYRPRDVFDIWFFHTKIPDMFDYGKISNFFEIKSKGKLRAEMINKQAFRHDDIKKRASRDYTLLNDTISGIPLPSFDEAFTEVLHVVDRLSIPD